MDSILYNLTKDNRQAEKYSPSSALPDVQPLQKPREILSCSAGKTQVSLSRFDEQQDLGILKQLSHTCKSDDI
jgi:hypothetical protein